MAVNIVQVTIKSAIAEEAWFDVMELPETVNDMRVLLEAAKKDFGDGRKVRIVQVMEE